LGLDEAALARELMAGAILQVDGVSRIDPIER
jgi:hypothetical protein